jgi:hypothetical protein
MLFFSCLLRLLFYQNPSKRRCVTLCALFFFQKEKKPDKGCMVSVLVFFRAKRYAFVQKLEMSCTCSRVLIFYQYSYKRRCMTLCALLFQKLERKTDDGVGFCRVKRCFRFKTECGTVHVREREIDQDLFTTEKEKNRRMVFAGLCFPNMIKDGPCLRVSWSHKTIPELLVLCFFIYNVCFSCAKSLVRSMHGVLVVPRARVRNAFGHTPCVLWCPELS